MARAGRLDVANLVTYGNTAPAELTIPKRFVVIAPQGLGDTLEATPMLQALRKAEPEASIATIVLRPAARDLLRDLPEIVDEVIYLPYWERGTASFLAMAVALPFLRKADFAFLTYPAARLNYLALLSAVPATRRYAHLYLESNARKLLSTAIMQIPVTQQHNTVRNMDLLRAAGLTPPEPLRYVVPKDWRAGPRDSRLVVMHIGTIVHHGLEARRWPEASFAELGKRLATRGYDLTLLAGPAERQATERVASLIPGARVISEPLANAARIMSRAAAVVANDSGIAHVAAGVGAPVLALFGPTPIEHGPLGSHAVAFRPTQCPPCFDVVKTDTRCKLNIDYACLKADLRVDLVERRLLHLMDAAANETREVSRTRAIID